MKHPPLTAIALRNVTPPETGTTYLPDGGCPGLRLRISANGRMAWVLNCRDHAGKVRSIALGEYSGAGSVGLADARERARRERQKLKDGQDSVAERKAARAAAERRKHADTLQSLLLAYEQLVATPRQAQGKARSWNESRRRIEDVFHRWLNTPLEEVTAPDLQRTIDSHPARSSAAAACRYLRPVLRWGELRGLVIRGTGQGLTPPEGVNRPRDRVLNDTELKAIWQALPELAEPYGDLFKWLTLTCCRLNEATSARWSDVDLIDGIWYIPQTKQGKPHAIPLSRQALALLAKRAEGIDSSSLIFGTRTGGQLSNFDRLTKRLQAASRTVGWHRHDLRRTGATIMADTGVAPHVIEMVLGHALASGGDGSRLSRMAAIYNKSRYQNEVREALQQLADRLDGITGDNIATLSPTIMRV